MSDPLQSKSEVARTLMRLLLTSGNRMSREAFRHVRLEGPRGSQAFKRFMHATRSLEEPRAGLLQALAEGVTPEPDALLDHWLHTHALGHLAILSSSGDTGWFDSMLRAVPVRNWTPTYALVRERSMSLALRGAWMVGQLGECVVRLYLPILERPAEPLLHFNAVLALAMAALTHPVQAAPVKAALAAWAARSTGPGEFRKEMQDSATFLLDAPEDARAWCLFQWAPMLPSVRERNGGWLTLDIPEHELLILAMLHDSGDCGVQYHRRFPAILLLSHLLSRDADELYPPVRALDAVRQPWSPRSGLDVLARSCPKVVPPRS